MLNFVGVQHISMDFAGRGRGVDGVDEVVVGGGGDEEKRVEVEDRGTYAAGVRKTRKGRASQARVRPRRR